jgi:hypothetical protein
MSDPTLHDLIRVFDPDLNDTPKLLNVYACQHGAFVVGPYALSFLLWAKENNHFAVVLTSIESRPAVLTDKRTYRDYQREHLGIIELPPDTQFFPAVPQPEGSPYAL